MNIFLANIIKLFHILVILFIIIIPFIKIPILLFLHIIFVLCILCHWYLNSNICFLSILEAQLRGTNRYNTYTHQFIAPIYDMSFFKKDSKESINLYQVENDMNILIWSITILLMMISIYKLYYSKKIKDNIEYYKKKYIKPKCYKSYFKYIIFILSN